jgi:hypothetical protein
MNADISIINRNNIPNDIYLCGSEYDEWNIIHLCTFDNGLQCILGANNYQSADSIIESSKDEMDYVLLNNNPEELQNYFYENFQDFKTYTDCVKIFNYYTINQYLIREAYYTFFEQEESDEDLIDEEVIINELEEGYSSD